MAFIKNGVIMKIKLILIGIITLIQCTSGFAMGKSPLTPIESVKNVDLNRYLGKWYEIARLPQIFEKDCVGVTAEYSLRSDGKIIVNNTCRKNSCEAAPKSAPGIARVVDTENHSKLKVSFFWPFEGDYWILDLDPNYQYAVVGSPDRKSFWILSRTPSLSSEFVDRLISQFQDQGFDLSQIVRTQSCE
jgi:apolipoprotein D and lipocalin family protein